MEWLWRRKHRGQLWYKIEVRGGVCRLALYGHLDTDNDKLISDILAGIEQLDWQELEVDCRRLKPRQLPVLGTHFAAIVVKFIGLVERRSRKQGRTVPWSFYFRQPGQIKVFAMARLSNIFQGHVVYGRRLIILKSPENLSAPSADF